MSDKLSEARVALREAEAAYGTAESNLIRARRACKDAEREYLREIFPTQESVSEYFRS